MQSFPPAALILLKTTAGPLTSDFSGCWAQDRHVKLTHLLECWLLLVKDVVSMAVVHLKYMENFSIITLRKKNNLILYSSL